MKVIIKITFLLSSFLFCGCSSQPENLVYKDTFDGEFNKDSWEIRHNTQWEVKDGYLIGSPSPSDYQERMRKKNAAYTGQSPIIRLLNIPAKFTCSMRLKFEAKDYENNRPLLFIGHHINSFLFKKTAPS